MNQCVLFFFWSPLAGTQRSLKPECASGAERGMGCSGGQEHCFSVFACVSFVLFHSLPLVPSHMHTPTQAIPVSVTAAVTAWRLSPEGRDLLAHTGNCGPKSTWRIPVAFFSLSSSCLVWKGNTVAGMHSRANILKTTYLVQEPEG